MFMIKKITAFLISLCLVLPCIYASAQSQISVTAEFVAETVEVESETAVKITVEGNVKKVKANIAYNNYFFNYRAKGLGFDTNTGEYTVTFTPAEEPFMLYCSASNSGTAEIVFRNVTCETDEGNVNLGDISVKVNVIPQYIRIYTKEDLNKVRNNLSGSYLLMNDIEFTEEDFLEGGAFYNDGFGWIPVGAVFSNPFKGEFNGNGHTVSGLKVNKAYYNYCGLFGVSRGLITSLRIKDATIDGRTGINMSSTASAPDVNGNIDYEDKNVWTEPDDSITEESLEGYDRTGKSTANAGIICGFNLGAVKNCFASGDIYSNSSAGGVTGRNNGVISGCAVKVKIMEGAVAGGIAGVTSSYSSVTDCVSEGNIEASLSGGILGQLSGTVSRVYSLCTGSNIKACFGKASGGTATETYGYSDAEDDTVSALKPLNELSQLRFSGGSWNYSKEIPYPESLSDLVKEVQPDVVLGDANGDGAVDTSDLASLKLYLAGMGELNEKNADYNADSIVDTSDLASLKLVLAGVTS